MGWSDMTYRYKQYQNAEKYIDERIQSGKAVLLSTEIKPREGMRLIDTLFEALAELTRLYRKIAVLEPEEEEGEYYDQWFSCSNCGAMLSPLYWDNAPEEWSYCPSCGCRFVGEHTLEEMGIAVESNEGEISNRLEI